MVRSATSCLHHSSELLFCTEYIDQDNEQIALSPRYPREFQDSTDEGKTGFDSIVKWNAPRTYLVALHAESSQN